VESIEDFLRLVDCAELASLFKAHQVTLQDLATLSRQDLAEMKIPIGPRNRILKAAEKLDDSASNQEAWSEASSYLRYKSEASRSDSDNSQESIGSVLEKLERQQDLMMKAIRENSRALELLMTKRPL
jgi:hypothetical protein